MRRRSEGGAEVLTFRRFRDFIAVAETGSVSRAARQVGIAHSAITAAIQALETEILVRSPWWALIRARDSPM